MLTDVTLMKNILRVRQESLLANGLEPRSSKLVEDEDEVGISFNNVISYYALKWWFLIADVLVLKF
jgi:hypothetical protein